MTQVNRVYVLLGYLLTFLQTLLTGGLLLAWLYITSLINKVRGK